MQFNNEEGGHKEFSHKYFSNESSYKKKKKKRALLDNFDTVVLKNDDK